MEYMTTSGNNIILRKDCFDISVSENADGKLVIEFTENSIDGDTLLEKLKRKPDTFETHLQSI